MGVNGIYGLSGSGMDIDSLVKVGMMSKQNEYDKMAQKYTKDEWTKSAYLEVNDSITTFNSSTLSQYKMSNNMNAKTVESSNASVKVSANASAVNMTHTVAVSSLSSNAYLISTATPTKYNNNISDNSNYALGNRLFQSFTVSGDTITGKTQDGKEFSANKSAKAIEFTLKDGTKDGNTEKSKTISITYEQIANGFSMNDLASKINSAGLNIKASYDTVNDKFSIYNSEGGVDNKISIQITSQDISTTTNTTNQTQAWILNDSDPQHGGHWGELTTAPTSTNKVWNDVVGSNTANLFNSWKLYQSKDGELYDPSGRPEANGTDWVFTAGEKETIKNVTNTTYTGLRNNGGQTGYWTNAQDKWVSTPTETDPSAGYYDWNDPQWHPKSASTTNTVTSNGTNTTGSTESLSGTNGVIKVDGATYNTTDNKVTVNGVTYTALDTTKDSTGAVRNAIVSVTQDTDAIIDKVKSFVADYNKLLSGLYTQYDQKPNSDYKPLTQSQKDSMKEDQITKWEEKAKAGLLYHDQTLGKIIQNIRSSITESIDLGNGESTSVFSIGISTTGLKGQLVLDEDKLKKALAEDPDAVYNVFAKLDSNDLNNKAKSGIAQRLGDVFTAANKTIRTRAGSTADITEDSELNNRLRNLQTRMSNFKKMMRTFENALYKRYDKMESALASLGSQLSFIMGTSGS